MGIVLKADSKLKLSPALSMACRISEACSATKPPAWIAGSAIESIKRAIPKCGPSHRNRSNTKGGMIKTGRDATRSKPAEREEITPMGFDSAMKDDSTMWGFRSQI